MDGKHDGEGKIAISIWVHQEYEKCHGPFNLDLNLCWRGMKQALDLCDSEGENHKQGGWYAGALSFIA